MRKCIGVDSFACGFRFDRMFFSVFRFWMIFSTVLRFLMGPPLVNAALAKSSPLDFPSEKSFLLFFVHEKGLGHMSQN